MCFLKYVRLTELHVKIYIIFANLYMKLNKIKLLIFVK